MRPFSLRLIKSSNLEFGVRPDAYRQHRVQPAAVFAILARYLEAIDPDRRDVACVVARWTNC